MTTRTYMMGSDIEITQETDQHGRVVRSEVWLLEPTRRRASRSHSARSAQKTIARSGKKAPKRKIRRKK
jgi:hypothetical protein